MEAERSDAAGPESAVGRSASAERLLEGISLDRPAAKRSCVPARYGEKQQSTRRRREHDVDGGALVRRSRMRDIGETGAGVRSRRARRVVASLPLDGGSERAHRRRARPQATADVAEETGASPWSPAMLRILPRVWSPSRDGDRGVREGAVELTFGRYHFRYKLDGSWIDPTAGGPGT